MAIDGQAGSVAVKHLQSLGNVRHTDSHPRPAAAFFQLSPTHADPVILDFNNQLRFRDPAPQVNAAAFDLGCQPVFDGIFHQRLQQHAGDYDIERGSGEFLAHSQLVAPEAHNFDIEVVVDEFDFVPQGRKSFARIQQAAENCSQLEDHVPRHVGVEAHQRRNRIQCIEQKVRIDLVLQSFHVRVQQKAFLLFQLDLDADAVENLELNPDCDDRRGVDRDLYPQVSRSLEGKNRTWEVARQFSLHKPQPNHSRKKHDLPVEQPRPR